MKRYRIKQVLTTLLLLMFALVVCSNVIYAATHEITWYTWPWQGAAEDQWKKDLEEFRQQTGIKVNVINLVPSTDKGYEQKLLLLFASGDVPDLIHLRGQREYPMMGSMQAVRDLSTALKKSKLPLNDYAPSMMESLKWEGVQIGMPDSADFYMTMYNVDEFNRAGLAKPRIDWTWDEVLAIAKRLTIDRNGDGTPEQYGLFVPNYAYEEMILSANIPALKPDRTWNWTSTVVEKMLDFWRDMFIKEKVVNPNADDFGAGKHAMAIDGNWALSMDSRIGFNWDVNSYPRWAGQPHGLSYIIHGYAIPKQAKNPDDAFIFLEWLMSRERQLKLTAEGRYDIALVPDRQVMQRRLSVVGKLAPSLPNVFMWALENGSQPIRPSFYIGDQNYWDMDYIESALRGEMGTRNALEMTEQTYNAMLKAGASWSKRSDQ